MSTIHQPEPKVDAKVGVSTQPNTLAPSNRLLSSHHSVLEMLHSKQDEIISPRMTPSPISLNFSATSWQSIGDYLSPRPTSSVLSNSDIEDEISDHSQVKISSRDLFHPIDLQQEEDNKTIEINLNSGLRSGGSIDGSNFVLPDISTYRDINNVDQLFEDLIKDKILIIGHKKANFFRMLDDNLRVKFTLNIKDNYKLILVLFDGLVKIGNILNFMKRVKTSNYDNGKLIIPVFRNINLKIINKILASHSADLLCPPINYENKKQFESLLNFLSEDFLLRDSDHKKIGYDSEEDVNNYQLIKVSSDGGMSFEEESSEDRALFKQSVIIRHHTLNRSSPSLAKSNLRASKKLRSKQARNKKYFLLTISLSLGLGIGITSAYFISFWKSGTKSIDPPQDPISSYSIKGLKKATAIGIKSTSEVLKNNVQVFKIAAQDVSNFFVRGLDYCLVDLTRKWDNWIVNVGSSYNNTMLWVI